MIKIFFTYLNWMRMSDIGLSATYEAVSGWCLANKFSYRLPSSALKSKVVGLKTIWRMIVGARPGQAPIKLDNSNSTSAIFDARFAYKAMRLAHVQQNTGKVPTWLVSRADIMHLMRPLDWLPLVLLIFPWVGMWSLVSKNRANVAILANEIVEAKLLLRFLKENQINHLYFYCSYEKDANALYLLLRKNKITVTKMPSPGVLAIHHALLLTDEIGVGSPYQADEIRHFANREGYHIKYEKLLHWSPQAYHQYQQEYEDPLPPIANSIGYYSHGSWIREELGFEDELGDHAAERKMLEMLAPILMANGIEEITLFLHPKEKKNKTKGEIEAYYQQYFNNVRLIIGNESNGSTSLFNKVDIGIGALSTILFERVFCGYKTVFFPVDKMAFPVPSSAMVQICPKNQADLQDLMVKMLADRDQTYYWSDLGIESYRRDVWLS